MKTFNLSKEQRKQKMHRLSKKQLKQLIGGTRIGGDGDGGYPDPS